MSVGDITLDAADRLGLLWQDTAISGATSDMLYHVLREALIARVLPPGQRMAEEQLARIFNVSRTPIREALVRLEAEGFVERIPRRGLVASRITPQEIIDVYVVRQSIDALAAELAASTASPADIAALISVNNQFAAAVAAGDLPGMVIRNLQFHEAVARVSRNVVLLDIAQQIHHRVRRFPGTTFSQDGRAPVAVQEHRQLIDAVAAHQSGVARQLAADHMATAREIRIAMLAMEPDGS